MSSHHTVRSLIESENFPFEFLSTVAKRESWRKEVYRPVYHVHKWWAKRLGSVFRGILLGGVLPEGSDLEQEFYQPHALTSTVIFDPFMGSGTTIGEAQKLGMTALGRDINPVACEAVRVALSPLDTARLHRAYDEVSRAVEDRIRNLYASTDERGKPFETLYYFWVKQAHCPRCSSDVDLFKSFVFARNAYPNKKPEVQVVCPSCSGIFESVYKARNVTCPSCCHRFDQNVGPARASQVTCACGKTFAIAKAVRRFEGPPKHRLYAKLVLRSDGLKEYLAAADQDSQAYAECEMLLQKECANGRVRLPARQLKDGYNTRQAIGYNYTRWRDFFNARQLLALSWLHEAISELPYEAERDALLSLFSGILEFNNLFASFKGEGTGAVRHMFSHHVLKPEMTPIEANVWGTPKSSGSFSGLYKTRLLRALAYRQDPFEVGINGDKKVFGVSAPMAGHPLSRWGALTPGSTSLSCGDSAASELPGNTVDLVITDPPFFDNVHYSELADFFYAWQTLHLRGFVTSEATTRYEGEVQDADADRFSSKLQAVFSECYRLLKDDGLLVFSYHHSRADGWGALAQSIWASGFFVVQAHPVYAELSAAAPKSRSKDPILIDAIIVCKKGAPTSESDLNAEQAVSSALSTAISQLKRLSSAGFEPTDGDKFVAVASQFLVAIGRGHSGAVARELVNRHEAQLRDRINESPLQIASCQ